MKKATATSFILVHGVLLILIGVVLLAPKHRPNVSAPWCMLLAMALIELKFLHACRKTRSQSACDIALVLWTVLLCWELATSVVNAAHPVLFPCPENVFDTFREQGGQLLLNIASSMALLTVGFASGMILAIGSGLAAGWFPRLGDFAVPIANVMAPIPPIVFSPYLVALMPSFRSASLMVIILGVFWPNFLSTINRVRGIDPKLLDIARILCLRDSVMIARVLFPYVLPGILSGLKVSLTTSLLMLNFAELMGATHGMGYYVQNSITYANYTHAVSGIICIGIVVTILNRAATVVQKKAIKWR